MPVNAAQCSRYTKLAKGNPAILSNIAPGQYLDINSELKLLSLDDDTAEEVRDFASEHELTRKEIAALTKELATR